MKRLVVIDGHSLLYRSYYAIRTLSNSKGFPTNALFGFLTTFNKILLQENPDYITIAFDSKGPTFRHQIYKEYKATRKPMPEDLRIQIPVLYKILDALKITCFIQEGYEADDLIGSISKKASEHEIQTILISSDKDFFQLIDKQITMYHSAKDLFIGEKEVTEIFGVSPNQVTDVLALWGDSSDNIPGVPGIGEKTAKSLINQFGSLSNLKKNINQIKNPKLKEKIEKNLNLLDISLFLATIKRDVDLDIDFDSLSRTSPVKEKIIPLLKELEFNSLLSNFLPRDNKENKDYQIILKESELKKIITQIKKEKFVAIDTETDSPYPCRANLVGISFSIKPDQAFYLPLGHNYESVPQQIEKKKALDLLAEVFSAPAIKKIGQNIKYDVIVLKQEGITVEGIDLDSMILSYLLEPNWGGHNFNRLAKTYLHMNTVDYHEIAGKGKNEIKLNAVDIKKVGPYACQDADITLKLANLLWTKIKEKNLGSLYRKIEQPLIKVLADMEMWGIKLNKKIVNDLSGELEEKRRSLQNKIFEMSGSQFNINSPQQLSQILFEKMKLPSSRKTKKTKGYSTSVDVLKELANKYHIARHILEYRQLSKLKSGYADSLPKLINPKTKRIHTSYNQTVASTGRLSSSDPNLQNIPVRGEWGKRFRRAFIPEKGFIFLSADYSQIELRVLAHLSKDENLCSAFLKDQDIHEATARRVFSSEYSLFKDEYRRRAKIINFSIIYGTSAFSLAKELGTSASDAQAFIDLYYNQYPDVKNFLERIVIETSEKGYSETLFGRIRQVPELKSSNKNIQHAGRRIALNTPIQGTAADIIKKAMIDIWEEIIKKNMRTRMVLQVHDELVFEVPDNEQETIKNLVQTKMENVCPLIVPLKVNLEWGVNWAEAK